MKAYVDYVCEIIKNDTEGMDAIYKDYIIQMVGVYGFNIFYEARLLEGCGSINAREMHVLLDRKGVDMDEYTITKMVCSIISMLIVNYYAEKKDICRTIIACALWLCVTLG